MVEAASKSDLARLIGQLGDELIPSAWFKHPLPEFLEHFANPLRSLVLEVAGAIAREFPRLHEPIFLGPWMCFLSEANVLNWLLFLIRQKTIPIDEAIQRLHAFYLLEEVEVGLNIIYIGLDARNFGPNLEYGQFTIGVAAPGLGRLDVGLPAGTYNANEIFTRTQTRWPISFGGEPRSNVPDFIGEALLFPLQTKMRLLGAQLRTPLYPIASAVKFDNSIVPLAGVVGERTAFWAGVLPERE